MTFVCKDNIIFHLVWFVAEHCFSVLTVTDEDPQPEASVASVHVVAHWRLAFLNGELALCDPCYEACIQYCRQIFFITNIRFFLLSLCFLSCLLKFWKDVSLKETEFTDEFERAVCF